MSRLRKGHSQRCVYYFNQKMFEKGKPKSSKLSVVGIGASLLLGKNWRRARRVSRSNHTAITIAPITINTITDRPSVTPDCDKFDSMWHKKCGRKAPLQYFSKPKEGARNDKCEKIDKKNKKIMSGPAPFSMGCLPRVRRGSVKS